MNANTNARLSHRYRFHYLSVVRSIVAYAFFATSLVACQLPEKQKLDIRGSWYGDEGNGGNFDSLVNYMEVYFNDSVMEIQEERVGNHSPRAYFLKKDSIFIELDKGFVPVQKVVDFKNDTLWLNPKFISKNGLKKIFLVRLPPGEKGVYDHTWDEASKDSLKIAIGEDWNRRKWKYHCQRLGRMDYYDSMTKAGAWKWTMKEVREAEKREREYLRTHQ